ncbi:DNA primase [Salinisphaera orenii YIM 95161]|uniref:DNA primase n=2 Tax=Salinisphaera TaxID=180541 RepID=A0A423PM39_9GAMM|nr:DNA primase [Salinisphaera halophila YIM 95161]
MPPELMARANWLLWRREKKGKVPYQADEPRRRAKSTDPATWASFDATRAAYKPQRDAGVGFALDGDGLAVIDIDGDTREQAIDLLHDTGCRYIEASPSGNGLHGWGLFDGELPRKQGIHDGISVEIYNSARYMSVTGNVINAGRFKELHSLHELSASLKRATATQSTQETQETQEAQETQVRGGVVPIGDEALKRFLPPTVGTRNKYLFALARHLKAQVPDASRADLRGIIKDWHRLALPTIGTQDFTESWGDFIRGWDAVRCPEGELLAELLKGVDDDLLPDGVPDDYGPKSLRLVKICQRLQHHAGNEPFFISARTTGDLLGIHYTNAANMLRALMADEVIELIQRGTRKDGQASQYRLVAGAAH